MLERGFAVPQNKINCALVRPNKKNELFLGHQQSNTSVFKVPNYVFLSLSKNKIEIKTGVLFQNIVIGNGHGVPLRLCGPLRVISGWLIILAAIFRFYAPNIFHCFC